MTASEETQEIAYGSSDTIEFKAPRLSRWVRFKMGAKSAWSYFVDRVAPALVGCLLGTSIAIVLWLLFLTWWLNA